MVMMARGGMSKMTMMMKAAGMITVKKMKWMKL